MRLTAAVVTSSIGRPTLRRAIESVAAQSVPARHYVFAHGREFWEKTAAIAQDYPSVEFVKLPNNNGSNGYCMAPVFAAAPYIVSEDVIFYLDDDNWYESEHIERALDLISKHDLGWAFSLRNIVSDSGEHICVDTCESLGYFKNVFGSHLVDNSCYCVRTEIARRTSWAWYQPVTADRNFLKALLDLKIPAGCTGVPTVNYRLSLDGSQAMSPAAFVLGNQEISKTYGESPPWREPSFVKFSF